MSTRKEEKTNLQRVYDVFNGRWGNRHSVDVKEGLEVGSYCTLGPSIEVSKNSKKKTICKCQLEDFIDDGWKKGKVVKEPEVEKALKFEWVPKEWSVGELKKHAEDAGVPNFSKMRRRSDLCKALNESGHLPPEEEIA